MSLCTVFFTAGPQLGCTCILIVDQPLGPTDSPPPVLAPISHPQPFSTSPDASHMCLFCVVRRLHRAGVACPRAYLVRRHVLFMQLISTHAPATPATLESPGALGAPGGGEQATSVDRPAPTLKECANAGARRKTTHTLPPMTPHDWLSAYLQCLQVHPLAVRLKELQANYGFHFDFFTRT